MIDVLKNGIYNDGVEGVTACSS